MGDDLSTSPPVFAMPSRILAALSRLIADPADPSARALYLAAAEQARNPAFYTRLAVPDTLDGRYELVTLHVYLLLRALKGRGKAGHDVGRRLMEVMVDDFDRSLREMGVGDTGIARRVKQMARGFAGRQAAYDAAMEAPGDEALDVAVDNNIYGTVTDVPAQTRAAMIAYIRREAAPPDASRLAELLAGRATFGPVMEE